MSGAATARLGVPRLVRGKVTRFPVDCNSRLARAPARLNMPATAWSHFSRFLRKKRHTATPTSAASSKADHKSLGRCYCSTLKRCVPSGSCLRAHRREGGRSSATWCVSRGGKKFQNVASRPNPCHPLTRSPPRSAGLEVRSYGLKI